MLAFAITIHKSQGLSVRTAIVDAGSTNFGPGMVYVALSRVTSLSGLHLIDLNKTKIACDHKAVDEYNRLRRLYAPHLGAIRPEGRTGRMCAHQHQTRQKRRKRTQDLQRNHTEKITKKSRAEDGTTTIDHHQQDHTAAETNANINNNYNEVTTDVSLHTFDCRQINSLDETFQMATCSRLNLELCPVMESVMTQNKLQLLSSLSTTSTATRPSEKLFI